MPRRVTSVLGCSILSIVLVCISCTACRKPKADHPKPKIGVFLVADHPAVNQIYDGFKERLNEQNVVVDYEVQNAGGDSHRFSEIATHFSTGQFPMVFVVGTPCAQAMKSKNGPSPVLFAGIPDPVMAGVVESMERPGGKITGAALFPPIRPLAEMLPRILPKVKTIGVIYNSGEDNSTAVVKSFKNEMTARGYSVTERTVTASSEVGQALTSLLGKVDALYIPTDSTVQVALPSVIARCKEAKLPTFASDAGAVRRGALFGLSGDYHELGRLAGDMAKDILSGRPTSTMAVRILEQPFFTINLETARNVGITISPDVRSQAKQAYETVQDK